MTETRERTYEWAHGWVPLTLHAAILKAHGNHEAAERLLADHHARRAAAAGDFRTPLHDAVTAHHATRVLRSMSDDQLSDAMGTPDLTDAGPRVRKRLIAASGPPEAIAPSRARPTGTRGTRNAAR